MYTVTPAYVTVGRFSRQHVLNAAGVTVATLTYATASDPDGISGSGGHLTPTRGLHLTEWPLLVAHMGKARGNGYTPSELEARGFDGVEAMRAAILAPVSAVPVPIVTALGTPYTTGNRGAAVVVTVGNGRAAKAVQRQASGVFHSLDGQSFPNLDAVADGMRWAL